jgi:hypothetical protein
MACRTAWPETDLWEEATGPETQWDRGIRVGIP